jgi:hypothetical protein
MYRFKDDLMVLSAEEGFTLDSFLNMVPDKVFTLETFQAHAKGVVTTVEQVLVTMLTGSQDDLQGLSKALMELGTRHVKYGE